MIAPVMHGAHVRRAEPRVDRREDARQQAVAAHRDRRSASAPAGFTSIVLNRPKSAAILITGLSHREAGRIDADGQRIGDVQLLIRDDPEQDDRHERCR